MNLPNALIGHSGFVGTTLKKQKTFEQLYRSTNIADIRGQAFEVAVCAASPSSTT